MKQITIFTEKIYFDHKEITDEKEIARIIKSHISHLGNFSIYYLQYKKSNSILNKLSRIWFKKNKEKYKGILNEKM